VSSLRISLLSSNRDNRPRGVDVEWSELPTLLGVRIAPCTIETCAIGPFELVNAKGKVIGCRCKYGTAWTPAVYATGATRANANVGTVSALVVDFDHLTDEAFEAATDALGGYAYHAHPSHSDRPGDRCWRLIIRLSEPVLGVDWPRFWRAALAFLEQTEPADASCKDPARLYFTPCSRTDADITGWTSNPGAALSVREILAIAEPRVEPRGLSDQNDLPPASPELLERCRQRLRDHGPAIEGSGGDNWTFSACAALIHGFALSEIEAWPLLCEWNETCEPPWDESELADKLANASVYAAGSRGAARLEWEASTDLKDRLTAGRDARLAAETRANEHLATLYDQVDFGESEIVPVEVDDAGPDEIDGLPFDHDAALRAIAMAVRGETEPSQTRDGFAGFVDVALIEIASELGDAAPEDDIQDHEPVFEHASELLARPDTLTPWLVRGLLKEGGIASIGAGPKVGKTWFALELAIAVATGTRAFGTDRFKVPRPRAVAYFFLEDDESGVKAHIRAMASGRGVTVEDLTRNLYLRAMGRHLDLTRDRDLARVIASCRQIPSLGLLVIDPLRNAHSGEENSSDDMANVANRIRFTGRKLGVTVMTPHHTKKLTRDDIAGGAAMSGAAFRGSSAFFGALDSAILLAADDAASDETHIVVDCRAIIKNAKSAGVFSMKLTIVDDDRDQAKHIEWAYQSAGEKRVEEATEEIGPAMAADLAVAMVEHMRLVDTRREQPLSVEKLRGAMKWGSAKLTAAMAYAQTEGWVDKPKMKWQLTDLGRRVDFGGA
jgi:RecA-family ATPase